MPTRVSKMACHKFESTNQRELSTAGQCTRIFAAPMMGISKAWTHYLYNDYLWAPYFPEIKPKQQNIPSFPVQMRTAPSLLYIVGPSSALGPAENNDQHS